MLDLSNNLVRPPPQPLQTKSDRGVGGKARRQRRDSIAADEYARWMAALREAATHEAEDAPAAGAAHNEAVLRTFFPTLDAARGCGRLCAPSPVLLLSPHAQVWPNAVVDGCAAPTPKETCPWWLRAACGVAKAQCAAATAPALQGVGFAAAAPTFAGVPTASCAAFGTLGAAAAAALPASVSRATRSTRARCRCCRSTRSACWRRRRS